LFDLLEDFKINNGIYNDLKPLFKEQLQQIECCLQEAISAREQVALAIKETKLSPSRIASSAKISRAHVDNHKNILKKYIELRIEQIESDGSFSLNNIKKQQEDYDEVRQWLKSTQKHLLENEVLESRIAELEQLTKHLQKEIEEKAIKINEQEITIEKLDHKVRKLTANSTNVASIRDMRIK
jgi:uncharacterized coiled-coil protein SlyX